MVCLSTDSSAAPAKNGKLASNSLEAEAASWQQVLEYNACQNVVGISASAVSAVEHGDESQSVISGSQHRSVGVSPSRRVMEHDTDAGSEDGHPGLDVEAHSSAGRDSLTVSSMAPRSRSAQDLSRQSELQSAHHRSAESLLDDRPRTLSQLDRLRLEDSGRRRRSFSGALHKAASAVAVRYRGLRDSVKAASSELVSAGDKLSSSDDLCQQAGTHS